MNKKLHYLTAAAIAAAVVFAGCKKDDDDKLVSDAFDGKITATVENGAAYNSQFSMVAAVVYTDTEPWYEILATGTYANGGFTITLPATLDAKYLETFEEFSEDGIPAGINVSDKNAKVLSGLSLAAANSNGSSNSGLIYGKVGSNSYTMVTFMYADRDVTVTGSYKEELEGGYTDEEHANVSLKKGWNRVYMTSTETKTSDKSEITTKPVSGVKWYFEEDFEDAFEAASGVKSKARNGSLKQHFFKK